MKLNRLLILLTILPINFSLAQKKKNPVEVGDVTWGRNYENILESAKKTDKPIFALFQEVPG